MPKSPFLLLVCLVLPPAAASSAERILSYDSRIDVHKDGSMVVTETIRVRAEGEEIKRGIYRDFPTTYRDRLGHRYRIGFELMAVSRDRRPEDFHIKQTGSGTRIYMGSKDVLLPRGEYTYELIYKTNRQLGFFDQHDELYWNVTGNDWAFPIDHAQAAVTLPDTVPGGSMTLEGYTGARGARGQDYRTRLDARSAFFETTRPLAREEGLTIVVSWPKGHVEQPGAADTLRLLLRDNRHLQPVAGGLLALLGYYLFAWFRAGRDPEAGVVIPLYEPPAGYSPAAMRYIKRMGYDPKCFATALVNLATKGHVVLREDDSDHYIVARSQPSATLEHPHTRQAPGETQLLQKLLGARNEITLKQSNHSDIKAALKAHERSLKADYEKRYFNNNSGFIVIGLLGTLLVQGLGLLALPPGTDVKGAAFMVLWLTVWSLAVYALGYAALHAWKNVRRFRDLAGAIGATGFALPFVFFEFVGLWMLSQATSVGNVIGLLLCLGVNLVFYQLMKAPTRLGRNLLDKVDGFRQYLDVAEKDELNVQHSRDMTPQLFETYLPYALALDVEQQWAERFAATLSAAQAGGERYRPSWYSGRQWNANRLGATTSSLASSLSSAVASSSRAPGSSSGRGGGGFSGGGGGGGGGGGW